MTKNETQAILHRHDILTFGNYCGVHSTAAGIKKLEERIQLLELQNEKLEAEVKQYDRIIGMMTPLR